MPRHAFRMRIRPELLDEYVARHEQVWPDMLQALRDAGWTDYTLFHDDEGVVFGVVEVEDLDGSLQQLASSQAAQRWELDMQQYFVPGTAAGSDRLTRYYHLE